jgi:hypothetical protein
MGSRGSRSHFETSGPRAPRIWHWRRLTGVYLVRHTSVDIPGRLSGRVRCIGAAHVIQALTARHGGRQGAATPGPTHRMSVGYAPSLRLPRQSHTAPNDAPVQNSCKLQYYKHATCPWVVSAAVSRGAVFFCLAMNLSRRAPSVSSGLRDLESHVCRDRLYSNLVRVLRPKKGRRARADDEKGARTTVQQ